MPVILSISEHGEHLWAAGLEGLFRVAGDILEAFPQPMTRPACCCALDDRVLMGGGPYGVAYRRYTAPPDAWQAAWMDGVEGTVLALAAAPDVDRSGAVLAGTDSGWVLRSEDRGHSWRVTSLGLDGDGILHLAWAPPAPPHAWPFREIVFAAGEAGIYRSPNGGRAWVRCRASEAAFQVVAPAPDFHHSGLVLAGSDGDGLWSASDGGRTFHRVADAPEQVNALAWTGRTWLLSDSVHLWRSSDGRTWEPLAQTEPCLTLAVTARGVLAGTEEGICLLDPETGQVLRRITQVRVPAG